MDGWDRYGTYAGKVPVFQYVTLDIEAVRIGTVEDYDFLPVFGTDAHRVLKRDIIGIITQADILQVCHQDVEGFQDLAWYHHLPSLVKRYDRNPRPGVPVIPHKLTRIRKAAETVLRRENRHDIDSLIQKDIEKMGPEAFTPERKERLVYAFRSNLPPARPAVNDVPHYSALVAQDSHTLAFQHRQICFKAFVSEDHPVFGGMASRCQYQHHCQRQDSPTYLSHGRITSTNTGTWSDATLTSPFLKPVHTADLTTVYFGILFSIRT